MLAVSRRLSETPLGINSLEPQRRDDAKIEWFIIGRACVHKASKMICFWSETSLGWFCRVVKLYRLSKEWRKCGTLRNVWNVKNGERFEEGRKASCVICCLDCMHSWGWNSLKEWEQVPSYSAHAADGCPHLSAHE